MRFEIVMLAGLLAGPYAGAIVGVMVGIPATIAGEWIAFPFAVGCGFAGGGLREICPKEAIWHFSPLFFAALLTLAVPVIIHLTQREKKQVVEFPSLMFLQRIPYQSVRRRRIRDWPLLAMRLAAILLIVMALLFGLLYIRIQRRQQS